MSVSILLPPSTNVFVSAFTNAAYIQRVTITPPSGSGSAIVWDGSGEGNNQIGSTFITTPGGSQNLTYTVTIQYSSDGGSTWGASSMIPGGTVIGSMNLKVVLGEDHVDQDYNDAVVEFLWWEPLG